MGPQAYSVCNEPEKVLTLKSIVLLRNRSLGDISLANIRTRLLNYTRHCFELVKLLVDCNIKLRACDHQNVKATTVNHPKSLLHQTSVSINF